MVTSMAAVKITITIPKEQLEDIRKRVTSRKTPSVSGFIQQAVQKSLENDVEFLAMLDESLERTGGPLTPEELAWATKAITPRKGKSKPRTAA